METTCGYLQACKEVNIESPPIKKEYSFKLE